MGTRIRYARSNLVSHNPYSRRSASYISDTDNGFAARLSAQFRAHARRGAPDASLIGAFVQDDGVSSGLPGKEAEGGIGS